MKLYSFTCNFGIELRRFIRTKYQINMYFSDAKSTILLLKRCKLCGIFLSVRWK